MDDFVWIQTRDNSPTLWSNELGEPFRSYKGAFSESWSVFVEPVYKRAINEKIQMLELGEFGLGLGTNWLFTVSAATLLNIPLRYWAIERDLRTFKMGYARWRESYRSVYEFFINRGQVLDEALWFGNLEKYQPIVFSSLEEAAKDGFKVNNWYHDPFGFSVNADGYSEESLRTCSRMWSSSVMGLSYACNKHFQKALMSMGMRVSLLDQYEADLKRQRLEFHAAAK